MISKLLLSLLFLSLVLPTAYAQSVGGSGSGGGGLKRNFPTLGARNPGCREGSRTLFYERDDSQDQTVSVFRTCQNGSYYDLTDYIYNPRIRCTEGRQEIWRKRKDDQQVLVHVVCSENKWQTIGRSN